MFQESTKYSIDKYKESARYFIDKYKLKEPMIIPWIHRTYCMYGLKEPSRIGEFREFTDLEPAQTIVSWIHWTGKHLKGCPVYRLQADHIERMKSGDWVEGNPQRSKEGHNDTRFSFFSFFLKYF